jgi:hypothetical protein
VILGDKFDEVVYFDNYTVYAAVYYLHKHLEQNPGLNEFFVCKLDDNVAMESGEISVGEQKMRDSDVRSIRSSATKAEKQRSS